MSGDFNNKILRPTGMLVHLESAPFLWCGFGFDNHILPGQGALFFGSITSSQDRHEYSGLVQGAQRIHRVNATAAVMIHSAREADRSERSGGAQRPAPPLRRGRSGRAPTKSRRATTSTTIPAVMRASPSRVTLGLTWRPAAFLVLPLAALTLWRVNRVPPGTAALDAPRAPAPVGGRALLGSLVLVLASWAITWTTTSPLVALVGLLVTGCGIAGQFPLGVSLVYAAVGTQRDRATGIDSFGVGIFAAVVPFMLGALADATSTHLAFLVVPVLVATVVVLLLVAGRRPEVPVGD